MFMFVKLNSLFDSDMVYYVTHIFKQGINIKTMCPNYILYFKEHKIVFIASLSGRVEQDRNCYKKTETFNI